MSDVMYGCVMSDVIFEFLGVLSCIFSETGHIWKIQLCRVLQRGIHTSDLP